MNAPIFDETTRRLGDPFSDTTTAEQAEQWAEQQEARRAEHERPHGGMFALTYVIAALIIVAGAVIAFLPSPAATVTGVLLAAFGTTLGVWAARSSARTHRSGQ